MDRDPQSGGIAIDLLAPSPDGRQGRPDLVRGHSVEVELVGEARREPPGHVGPVAADHDRDPWLLDRLWDVVGVFHLRVLAFERRPVRAPAREHPGDDLQLVAKDGQPLARLRKSVAVGQPLIALPTRADAELHPPAADRVEGRDELCRQGRIAVRGAQDDVAETDPFGLRRQRGENRERLERQLRRRDRHGVKVVEDPQRFEAETLGLLRHLDRPGPCRLGFPAVVLAGPALGHDHADVHGSPPD